MGCVRSACVLGLLAGAFTVGTARAGVVIGFPPASPYFELRVPGTPFNGIETAIGARVEVDLVVNTVYHTIESYRYGFTIRFGSVSDVQITHHPLEGLEPDVFGPPVIDEAAGTVRNVNQATRTTGPGLPAGSYVLDTLSFVITDSGGWMLVEADLYGGAFELSQGSCPECLVQLPTFFEIVIAPEPVPEPGTRALLAAGLVLIAAIQRSRTTRRR